MGNRPGIAGSPGHSVNSNSISSDAEEKEPRRWMNCIRADRLLRTFYLAECNLKDACVYFCLSDRASLTMAHSESARDPTSTILILS